MSRIHASVEAFRIAVAALRANKARGVLTTLGIIIGIVAVVTTMTAANGLANNFRESVSVLGTDVLYVSRTPWIIQGRFFQFRNRPNLRLKDSEKLARQLGSAAAVNPTDDTQRPVKYGSEIIENATVKEDTGVPKATEMIRALVADQATTVHAARQVVEASETSGDQASADLAVRRIEVHEKFAWMLRSHLEQGGLNLAPRAAYILRR